MDANKQCFTPLPGGRRCLSHQAPLPPTAPIATESSFVGTCLLSHPTPPCVQPGSFASITELLVPRMAEISPECPFTRVVFRK